MVDKERLAEMVEEETFTNTSQTCASAANFSRPHLCASALCNSLPMLLFPATGDEASYRKLCASRPHFVNIVVEWVFCWHDLDEVGSLEQPMSTCTCFMHVQWGSEADKKLLQGLHTGVMFEELPHSFTSNRIIGSIANELFKFLASPFIQSFDDRKLLRMSERKDAKNRGDRTLASYLHRRPGQMIQACSAWYIRYNAGDVLMFMEQFARRLPRIFQPELKKHWSQCFITVVTFMSKHSDLAARYKTYPISAYR
ncbi:hypothetical protein BDV98DRAFT_313217 [Pterulicium gracile]|uniref:Uncharacterized protein n=1 Tax=Pterulicium gracile TaxID=1884261 RepID=A0A5C3QUY7_9AGAR|nr:hypothetical protein BDV98DRAFT_313217 [Pterula gracilis]